MISIGIEGLTKKDKIKVEKIVKDNFQKIDQFINDLIEGRYRVE